MSYVANLIETDADLAKARARAVKNLAKYKRADIRAHYSAQIVAIDTQSAATRFGMVRALEEVTFASPMRERIATRIWNDLDAIAFREPDPSAREVVRFHAIMRHAMPRRANKGN